MEAVEIIRAEVRDLIRMRGIDPRSDARPTADLIDEVIRSYDERTLSGSLPLLADADAARRSVLDDLTGYGAIQQFLDDPSVEEIWVNGPHAVFVSRHGVSELTPVVLTEPEVSSLIEQLLRTTGRRVDLSSPFVDASLPDGSRLHIVLPDITRTHPAINIRKFIAHSRSLHDLVEKGSLTPPAARFLDAAVASGANVLVSGQTQAGKTTMLGALCGSIPVRDRVITCEEVFELSVPARDWVAMQCRQSSLEGTGEVALRRLVKEALRMRPDRIIVGEVREAESFDMLIAMNAGLPLCSRTLYLWNVERKQGSTAESLTTRWGPALASNGSRTTARSSPSALARKSSKCSPTTTHRPTADAPAPAIRRYSTRSGPARSTPSLHGTTTGCTAPLENSRTTSTPPKPTMCRLISAHPDNSI